MFCLGGNIGDVLGGLLGGGGNRGGGGAGSCLIITYREFLKMLNSQFKFSNLYYIKCIVGFGGGGNRSGGGGFDMNDIAGRFLKYFKQIVVINLFKRQLL